MGDIVKMLLAARASPGQTAVGRITPLMRAALRDHSQVCKLLLEAAASVDEWADRNTALDIALLSGHDCLAAQLKQCGARRYLEIRPAGQSYNVVNTPAALVVDVAMETVVRPSFGTGRRPSGYRERLRPGPHSQ